MTIHFVYVKGDSIATPYAITNEVVSRLSTRAEVLVYDWLEQGTIIPKQGDILIGHPYPLKGRIFENSFYQSGWAKRVVFCPFMHQLAEHQAAYDNMVVNSDRYIAICAEYWFDTLSESLCSHWANKMVQLDLAIRRDHFPRIKGDFNPPYKRKFLYIGADFPYKGTDILKTIAKKNPDLEFGWIGRTKYSGPHIKCYGPLEFSKSENLEIIREYDFLIHCARADANPTTILEAAAWGLIPICTPQSGYSRTPWVYLIDKDNINKSSQILRDLWSINKEELEERREKATEALDSYYNWERFFSEFWNALTIENLQPKVTCTLTKRRIIFQRSMLFIIATYDRALRIKNHIVGLILIKIKNGFSKLKKLGKR